MHKHHNAPNEIHGNSGLCVHYAASKRTHKHHNVSHETYSRGSEVKRMYNVHTNTKQCAFCACPCCVLCVRCEALQHFYFRTHKTLCALCVLENFLRSMSFPSQTLCNDTCGGSILPALAILGPRGFRLECCVCQL